MKQWFCEVSSISDLKKDDQHWGWGWTSDMFEEMIKCQKDPLAVASHPDPGLRPLPLCPWCLPSPRDSRLPTEAVQGNESIPRRRISKTPNLLSALLTWPSKTVAWLSSGLVALCRKIRPFIVAYFPIQTSGLFSWGGVAAHSAGGEEQASLLFPRSSDLAKQVELQPIWGSGRNSFRKLGGSTCSLGFQTFPHNSVILFILRSCEFFSIRRNFRKKNLLNCMFPNIEETLRNGERRSLQARCLTPAGKTKMITLSD